MANVRLTWALPAVGARQRAIQHTKIEFRALSITQWTLQDVVASDVAQELVFFDVAPGDYEYQATVVDVDNIEGAPVQTSISVPFDAPGSVTNFSAVLD